MSKADLVWFLIAGLVGAVGGYRRESGGVWQFGWSLPWAIVALWAFLSLIGVKAG